MGRPCCCKKNFPFLVIIFIDESSAYSSAFGGRSAYESDLQQFRDLQEDLGQIDIIIVQPEKGCCGLALLPPGTAFPKEVIEVYTDYRRKRISENNDIFKSIVEDHIRNQYSCIGIGVDVSGSTNLQEIKPGLDCFYFNISGGKAGEQRDGCEIYVDPLPDCVSGRLDLDRANGCVFQKSMFTERWLAEVIALSSELNSRGCKNKRKNDDDQQ